MLGFCDIRLASTLSLHIYTQADKLIKKVITKLTNVVLKVKRKTYLSKKELVNYTKFD